MDSNSRATRKWVVGILMGAMAAAGCNTSAPPPFNPRAAGDNERDSVAYPEARPMPPLPTTLESEFAAPNPNGAPATRPSSPPTTGVALDVQPELRLTLQEIVHRAVANSLDVKVAAYNPGIDATRVTEAEARFDPSLFTNFTYEDRNRPSAYEVLPGTSADVDSEQIGTFSTGIQQQLENGGTVSLGYTSTVDRINGVTPSAPPLGVNPNPFWLNELALQFNQPLLQGFGNDVNRAKIFISRNQQKISLLDFRKQLEMTLDNIEKDYWQLCEAVGEVKIDEALLSDTVHTGDILLNRVGNDVTRVQLSQANASVETRNASLIRARSKVRDLSDDLKRQMNDPELPISGGTLILPADQPIEQPLSFDKDDQIRSGLENRFELGQQLFRIDSAGQQLLVARNLLQPQLNLVGSVGLDGLGDDFGQAFARQSEADHFNGSIGFQLSIPIGNRAARAAYVRAQLQQQQAIDSYRNTIEQVTLDVSQALREVNTSWDELVAFRKATFAQNDVMMALGQREEGGEALTPTFVQLKLDTQERLADAQRQENTAVAAYNIAIYKLEEAKGTLLRYNNVIMEEDKPQVRGLRQP
jgi:outer membrane protein